MTIRLSEEQKRRITASIKRFVDETFDEEIGDLKASEFLRFCLDEIGPFIYNRGIADAQAYFQERVADLEGSCHAPERSYWDSGASGRARG